jgi:hypothetical protein
LPRQERPGGHEVIGIPGDADWEEAKVRYRWERVNALLPERDPARVYPELGGDPPVQASTKSEAMPMIAVFGPGFQLRLVLGEGVRSAQ